MSSLNFIRFAAAITVFMILSQNVFAQPKRPERIKTVNFDANLSEELNRQAFEKDIAEADEQIKLKPNDSDNYWRRGYIYFMFGEYTDALKDIDKAIKLNERNDALYNLRGHILFSKKSYVEAEKEFNKALKINPKDVDASRMIAQIGEIFNQNFERIRALDAQIAVRPNNPKLYEDRAYYYSIIGKRKEAETDLKKSEEINTFLKKDVYEECEVRSYQCQVDFFNRKIKITDDFDYPMDLEKYYSGRAAAYYEMGNLEDAFKDLNAVIEGFQWTRKVKDKRYGKENVKVKGGTARDFSYRGAIYFRRGLYEEALKDLKYSCAPTFPENCAYLGEIYRIRKEYQTALINYEKAIEYNRRSVRAYYGRAMIYLKIGDDARELYNDEAVAVEAYNHAVRDFNNVIEIDLLNTGGEVYLQRARVYYKLGETDKAEADIAKAREIDENP